MTHAKISRTTASLVVASLIMSVMGALSVQANEDDLVGYWNLEEGSGIVATDSTSYSNDGDIDGDADYTNLGIAAIPGNDYGLVFDGVNDFITVPHADELDMTSAYSFSGWVNVADVPSNVYRPIAVRGDVDANDIEIYVQARTGDLIVAHNRGNGGSFDFVGFADPQIGNLFHLVVTFDGTDVRAYYDGVLATVTQRTTVMNAPEDSDAGWWFGKVDHSSFGTLSGGNDVNLFKGLMDELRLYDAALTSEEVAGLFDPEVKSKDECKDGAWEAEGFKNQGQCIKFVNTGKDSR